MPGINEILISSHIGQTIIPLPESSRYLGFIIARAKTADGVESALRRAHRCLKFEIEPLPKDSPIPVLDGCNATRSP